MNTVAKVEQPRQSLIATMAAKYQMDPEQFAKTVRATVMPLKHTNEQFAALMLVANEYELNPIVKEIYAFPAKGGGIVPVVSVDGWISLVNSHPSADGFEFDFDHDAKGELVSCTCRMYRKDRGRPVTVTEYLSECIRASEPWKMKHRMLRHKAMIQAARYAFGFSGIYDEDEGAKIAGLPSTSSGQDRPQPPEPPRPPTPPVPPSDADIMDATEADDIDPDTGEILDEESEIEETSTDFFDRLEESLSLAKDAGQVAEIWEEFDALSHFDGNEIDQGIAMAIHRRHLKRVGG